MTNKRIKVGTVVTIQADGGYAVGMRNDMGGSAHAPEGTYEVTIVKTWRDYETGQRFIGMVTSEDDIKRITEAGKTPYEPKDLTVDHRLVYFDRDAIREVR